MARTRSPVASGGSSRDRRRSRRAAERLSADDSTSTNSEVELFVASAPSGLIVTPTENGGYLVRPEPSEDAADEAVLAAIETALADGTEVPVEDVRPVGEGAGPAAPVVELRGPARRWTAMFVPEAEATDDGRIMAPGSIRWRDLPLSLLAMVETPGEGGHAGALLAGRIDRIWKSENLTLAEGVFDSAEYGQEIARLVEERTLRGLSVDLAIPSSVVLPRSQVLAEDGSYIGPVPGEEDRGDPDEAPSLIDILFGEEGEDLMFVVLDGVIGMATVCPFPAFARAEIELAASAVIAGGAVKLPDRARWTGPAAFTLQFDSIDGEPLGLGAGVAAASEGLPGGEALTAAVAFALPVAPPADWFSEPEPDGPCPLTVTDEGRVYGHAAVWGTCHIGIDGVCVEPPASDTGYALFRTGEVVCDDGSRVPVGTVTLDTGHADRRGDAAAAAAHYDDTGVAVAHVAAIDGEHGIWVSGALLPEVSAEQARKLRGASLSGDWRAWEGNLELVALLAVNVPGFPVPRVGALVAAGGVVSLTAAGIYGVDREAADRVALEQIRALALTDELTELSEA